MISVRGTKRPAVFIIGIPRSGTTLLRNLLNRHPAIRLLTNETQFLPYWVSRWNEFGDLSNPEDFLSFYNQVIFLPYFINKREKGSLIECETWYNTCHEFTPAGVFEALVRHDTGIGWHSDLIWGDKSPSYVHHIPLLKKLYPNARIIHIARDVRDHCLSINKVWGKNMIRASQRWTDDIAKVRAHAKQFPRDFLEIRYEDLLDKPEEKLSQICDFLGVSFDQQMLTPLIPPDSLGREKGSAKGLKEILQTNKEKYIGLMKPRVRRQIEEIAASMLQAYGYDVPSTTCVKRINRGWMLFYQLLDGFNLVTRTITERGLTKGIVFSFKAYISSGNKFSRNF